MGILQKTDEWFAGTRIAKFFELEERGSTLSIELGGAIVTFMTMAYILAVNPRILAGKEKLDALDGCLLSF
jgi:AGZA family xanthine/uracil permease-like MFS transporter